MKQIKLFAFIYLFLVIAAAHAQVVVTNTIPMIITGSGTSCAESILGDIKLTETDKADFPIATGKSYLITLPAGFEFTNTEAAVEVTSSEPTFSETVRLLTTTSFSFSYTITAIDVVGSIVIKKLKVKCVTSGSYGDILHTGGSAIQVGNAPINKLSHGFLDSRITLNITNLPVAGKPYGCVDMPIQFTTDNISGAVYDLYRDSPSGTKVETAKPSNVFTHTPIAVRTNPVYHAEAIVSGCTLTSNTVTIPSIQDKPKATIDGGLPYNFTIFDNPVILNNYVKPNAGSDFNGTYPFAFKPYLYISNTGGVNYMIPNYVSVSNDFKLGYSLIGATGSSNEGCTAIDTVPTVFNIINPTTPPPYFTYYTSTPICELSTYAYSGIDVTKITSSSNALITYVKLYYKSGTVTLTVPANSKYYSFNFNPTEHINYRIRIEVGYSYTYTSGSATLTATSYTNGYYYIFKRRDVRVKGFPTDPRIYSENNVTYKDTAKICSASIDPLVLIGTPAGGNYEFYQCTDGTCATYTSITNFGSPVDLDNPSIYKLIPNVLFSKIANFDYSKMYLLKYNYPTLRIGDCAETRFVYIKFNQPTDLGYEITSPASISPTMNLFCHGATLDFDVVNNIADDSIYIDYGDGYTTLNYSPSLHYAHKYNAPGKYLLSFKTDREGTVCNNERLDTIRIGAQPSADFSFSNNYDNGKQTKLNSLSKIKVPNSVVDPVLGKDNIYLWSWEYGDGASSIDETDSLSTHSYPYYKAHPYKAKHWIKSRWGCTDTIEIPVPIFQEITPSSTDPYSEEFDATDSTSWYQSGDYSLPAYPLSSWSNEEPTGITIKQTGTQKTWITTKAKTPTHLIGYYENEQSYLESPAFDLSSLKSPMLALDTWCNTDNLFDGVSIQFAVCDTTFGNEKWITLGTTESGNNWYNSNTVVSAPGGALLAWTGQADKKFKRSACALEEVKKYQTDNGLSAYPVRFRVIAGTNGDNTPNETFDGFAFDNFYVGERNRKVLVEEFCDYLNYEPQFNTTSIRNNNQLIRIQYHTRYMNLDDEINNQNKGEQGARNLLYGYSQLPRAAVDGAYSLDFSSGFFNLIPGKVGIGERNFSKRSLEISPFSITIDAPVISGNNLTFDVNMTRNSLVSNKGPFVLQVAVLERLVTANGQTFTNVFRKFLPDASGEHVDGQNWAEAASKKITRSFTPFTPLTPCNDADTSLVLVAFIQDEVTSEIYQSEVYYVKYVDAKALVNVVPLPARIGGSEIEVYLYPNPAQNSLNLQFNGGKSQEDYQYKITDGLGKMLMSGFIREGNFDSTINVAELPVGLYKIQLHGAQNTVTKSFSIIR